MYPGKGRPSYMGFFPVDNFRKVYYKEKAYPG